MMSRHRHNGIRKICHCPRRSWAKCPHSWHFNFKLPGGPGIRFAVDTEVGKHIEAKARTGSWAGAMGQTQFMPSSYLKYAVDFDKDGRRDIWKSTPDALGSIANYLKGYEWKTGETWGREVKVSAAARERMAREGQQQRREQRSCENGQ